jgi:hypothetical protein
MSKGPGRVELAIEQAFADEPDNAFSVKDLCRWVYPRRAVEKKHRVAILRAIKGRPNTACCHTDMNFGGHRVGTAFFYTPDNVKSYAMARLKADQFSENETDLHFCAQLRKGGSSHHLIVPGGPWHRHTEIFKAKRDGNIKLLKTLNAEQDRSMSEIDIGLKVALAPFNGTEK